MGGYQYSDHAGMRDRWSMSGARLWAEAEAQRETDYKTGHPNKLGAELALLSDVASEIAAHVPLGTTVVELGPGTLRAFRKKTEPLLRALNSPRCYIVDTSVAFLHDVQVSANARGMHVSPIEADFFLGQTLEVTGGVPMLACSFGDLISNLIAPISDSLPKEQLSSTLHNFAEAIDQGWLLITFDSSTDAEDIIAYYSKHPLFQLNILDRMAVELPVTGDFDPEAFTYATEWRTGSNQLAHIAVLNKDMDFALDNQAFALRAGQRFHVKNSFKFDPAFFETCCGLAKLKVLHHWSRGSSFCYLLAKTP